MPHSFHNNGSRIYSWVFSVLVWTLLISFVSLPNFNTSTISTNFRWRRNLIDFYTSFRLAIGDKIYNNAVIGKHGWIFLTGDSSIASYQNTATLTNKKLMKLQNGLDQLNTDLRRKGITLLVVIPPNKSTIYPQYMPDEIPVIGSKSNLDQFVEYMRLSGDTFILDLRPTLWNVSRSQTVYYKTDSHWNDIGAYYAYAEIMRVLMLPYPALTPHPVSDFKYTDIRDSVLELPLLMGLSKYPEEHWVLVPNFRIQLTETNTVLPDGRQIRILINADKQLPKLLVFHDSFYDALAHYIEPHFSKITTIPFTYEDGIWSLDWIQRENPDIVIIEIVERYLDVTLPRLFEK